VLHPYYKLNYIKMAWGGEEERLEEVRAGNRDAKNWHQEAERIVEMAVCLPCPVTPQFYILGRWKSTMRYIPPRRNPGPSPPALTTERMSMTSITTAIILSAKPYAMRGGVQKWLGTSRTYPRTYRRTPTLSYGGVCVIIFSFRVSN
jgi:hypothetical protein